METRAALVLAGLTLAGHAGWDAVHHRRYEVVPRSMAEACIAVDVAVGVGVGCIALSVLG